MHLPALMLFLALALLATWPLVFQLTSIMLRSGGATDAYIFLWNSWWFKKAVLELGKNPYFADYIFYPAGTTLAYHSFSPTYALFSVPFQLLVPGLQGVVIPYNLSILCSFWLAGYFAYRLADHLTESLLPGLLAGVAFTFCNFHFANTVRLHAMGIEWIPAYVWLLFRYCRWRRPGDLAFMALCFVLCFYTSIEYAYFLALFTGLSCAGAFLFRRRLGLQRPDLREAWRLCLALAAVGASLLPYAQALWAESGLTHRIDLSRSQRFFSADLLDFVLPNPLHPLYGEQVTGLLGRLHIHGGRPDTGFGLGFSYAALLLAALGAFWGVRRRSPTALFWCGCWLFSGLMCLGPVLKFAGVETGVPLPFSWLEGLIPFFGLIQMPMRFVVLVHLSLSVLAALGLQALAARARARRRVLAMAALPALVFFESLSVPFPMQPLAIPAAYAWLGRRPEDVAIVDWPPGRGKQYIVESLHQIAHHKRLVQDLPGLLPRVSNEARAATAQPGLKAAFDSLLYGNFLRLRHRKLQDEAAALNLRRLRDNGVKYIALRRRELLPRDMRLYQKIFSLHGAEVVFEDPEVTLYRMFR